MRRVYRAIGHVCVRYRWLVVIVWILGTAASSQLPSLSSVSKSDNTSFLPAGTPSVRAVQLAAPVGFGGFTLTPVTVVAYRAGGLTQADSQVLTALRTAVARVPQVQTARDLGRSPDGQVEELQVLANAQRGESGADRSLVDNLRAAVAAVPHGGLSVHLAGQMATEVDSEAQSSRTGGNVQRFSVIFILILLLFVFRSALAPLITLFPAVLVTQLAGRIVGWAGSHGMQVSSLSQFMLIVLVIGAGTDYGLFLVFRVREELRAGLNRHDAIVRAVERVGESITFSALTVIGALLSLLVAKFGLYQSLGAPLAIAIAVMLLAGLTLLPALLAIFGRAAFWPSNISPAPPRVGLWGRTASQVVARPVLTLVLGVVLFGGLAAASTGNKPAGFATNASAPSGSDAGAGDALLTGHFPRAASNPTTIVFRLAAPVWTDPTAVASLQAAETQLAARPEFRGVTGPLDPNGTVIPPAVLQAVHNQLGPPRGLAPEPPADIGIDPALYQAYRATGQFVSPDGHTVLFAAALTAGDPSTTKALNAVPGIRTAVGSVAHNVGALDWGVAGQAPGIYDVSSQSNHDLFRVVPVAVIVIGILLGLVMRSLVAPLYLVASVAISYLAALGVAVIAFVDIGSSGGLTFILPFLMFLFLLALGEDYNILVMTRIREEAHELPLRAAITRAIGATGSTVTSAGLVLAGTFGVLTVAVSGPEASQVRDIGAGLAIGILMDTFLVRTLLVPSAVAILGRWNWWPSSMARVEHASVNR